MTGVPVLYDTSLSGGGDEGQLRTFVKQAERADIEVVLVEVGPVSEGLDPTVDEIAEESGADLVHVSEPGSIEDAVLALPFVARYRSGPHAAVHSR